MSRCLRADHPRQFRSMWTEFEWENRVNVTTSVTYAHCTFDPGSPDMLRFFYRNPREYLSHVMKVTNMSCLTPEGALSGDCDFLSANMYARSLFGVFYLAMVLRSVSQIWCYRRGRVSQLEYREDRTWEYHWSCADTKQNTGYCFIFGRPYHNISKGRKASCLMECVDTYEYYTIDQMDTFFTTRSPSGCPPAGLQPQGSLESGPIELSSRQRSSVPLLHRDRVLLCGGKRSSNNNPLLLTSTQRSAVTLRVASKQ